MKLPSLRQFHHQQSTIGTGGLPPDDLLPASLVDARLEYENLRIAADEATRARDHLDDPARLDDARKLDDEASIAAARAGSPEVTHAAEQQLLADRAAAADRARIAALAVTQAAEEFETLKHQVDLTPLLAAADKADTRLRAAAAKLTEALAEARHRSMLVRWYTHGERFGLADQAAKYKLPELIPATASLGSNAAYITLSPDELLASFLASVLDDDPVTPAPATDQNTRK